MASNPLGVVLSNHDMAEGDTTNGIFNKLLIICKGSVDKSSSFLRLSPDSFLKNAFFVARKNNKETLDGCSM
jgi:hypothetical protein